MTDVDTSSYPRPPLPVSPFDIANQYGAVAQRAQSLQSGQLTIQRQQLENAGLALTHMTQGLNSLGSNPTKNDIIGLGKNMVQMGLVPESMMDAMDSQIPDDPKFMPQFVDRLRTQAASHQEMINYFLGQPGFVQNGQQMIPIRQPESGAGPTQTGAPIQMQLPPTTPTVNQQPGPGYEQPGYVGPTGGSNPLPIAPQPSAIQPPMGAVSPPVSPSVSPPATPMGPSLKDQGSVPSGPAVPNGGNTNFTPSAPPPLFAAGQQQYTSALQDANTQLSSIKPAMLALDSMKGLTTGPGTVEFNKWMGLLKNVGIVPTAPNDSTAAYEATNKYLTQFLSTTPFKSDAERAMAQAGSPNAAIQINQALTKLTKTAIMLRRLNALAPLSFTPRTDFENFPQYAAKLPNDTDQRAVGLDMMEPPDRQALIKQMSSERDTPQGQRFFKTLDMANKAGYFQ